MMPKFNKLLVFIVVVLFISISNVDALEYNIDKDMDIKQYEGIDINEIITDAIDNDYHNYLIEVSDEEVLSVIDNLIVPKNIGSSTVRLIHNTNGDIYNINVNVLKVVFLNGSTSIETYNTSPVKLNESFDELKDYSNNIAWNVEYQNIVNVNNNVIVPITVGESDITTDIDNVRYVYHVKVLDDIKNPETASLFTYIIGSIMLIFGIMIISYAKKMKPISE